MLKRIGDFFIEKGLITPEQLIEILEFSHRTGTRFGEAAASLQILKREMLEELFGPHFKMDYSHIEPEKYVAPFSGLIHTDEILEWGTLPLVVKSELGLFGQRKLLQVGFLDPNRKEIIAQLEKRVQLQLKDEGIEGLKVVLLLPENFLSVLEIAFEVQPQSLKKSKNTRLDPTLAKYLKSL